MHLLLREVLVLGSGPLRLVGGGEQGVLLHEAALGVVAERARDLVRARARAILLGLGFRLFFRVGALEGQSQG